MSDEELIRLTTGRCEALFAEKCEDIYFLAMKRRGECFIFFYTEENFVEIPAVIEGFTFDPDIGLSDEDKLALVRELEKGFTA